MRIGVIGWLLVWGSAVALGQTPPIRGAEAIKGLNEDAAALATILTETSTNYSQVGEPIRKELSPLRDPVTYHNALFDLVVRTQDRRQVIDYTRWSQSLSQQLDALQRDLEGGVSRSELQDRFFAVHVAYVRTLVSTYVFIEAAKRQYLYADASYLLSESYRPDLENRLNNAHARAHRLMRWMHFIRTTQDLGYLTRSQYFPNKEIWEVQHGKNYHYIPNRPIARQGFGVKTDLKRYFTPIVATTETTTPAEPSNPGQAQPGTDRAELIRQWEQLQKDFEKPENRNNTELRAKLEELQRQLNAPQTDQPVAPKTDDNNAGSRNSTNDPRLNQLTIRLQGMLASPTVQDNAELKKALEDFLAELNPDQQGPIKPLPPQEEADEAKPKTEETPSGDF